MRFPHTPTPLHLTRASAAPLIPFIMNSTNIIFDFGNVLVRWEPERVYLPYFNGDEARYWYFWRHVCTQELRNRIDAGENQRQCIDAQKLLFPEFAVPLDMFITHWAETLPGEMPGMRQLLQELSDNPAIQIYGLTNWSMETFPLARQKFPILQMIDRYIVSADVKMVKPDPRIFRLLLDRYNLQPSHTLFIDDNPNNISAANSIGLKGILFHNAEQLRSDLANCLQ